MKRLVWKLLFRLAPNTAIKFMYSRIFDEWPNVENPTTFNEKVLRKILYDRNPMMALYADKLRVRPFVGNKIGGEYLTKLYNVVDDISNIYKITLPESFVMKANHLSGAVKIVRDGSSVSRQELKAISNKWLKRNYGKERNEWAYKDIAPSILFEELLLQDGEIPDDYKFFCFNGEPKFFTIDKGRFNNHARNFYDMEAQLLPVKIIKHPNFDGFERPKNYEKMVEIAKKLSDGIDFVRVDLYNIDGRIVFGELTNYPAGGFSKYDPPLYDSIFGSYWK